MKPFSLHREALEEFDAAAAHYAKIDPALGQRFYDVIDRLISEVCASPNTFRFIRQPARRHFTRELPYGIIYLERLETSGSLPSCRCVGNPATGSTG